MRNILIHHSFIFSQCLYPDQGCYGSKSYPGNAGPKAGIHQVEDLPVHHSVEYVVFSRRLKQSQCKFTVAVLETQALALNGLISQYHMNIISIINHLYEPIYFLG